MVIDWFRFGEVEVFQIQIGALALVLHLDVFASLCFWFEYDLMMVATVAE